MNRKSVEKKIRKALIAFYVIIFLLEAVALWLIIPSNNMDLLTVSMSFPQVMGVVLLMDIPLFLFVAIIVTAIKEAVLYKNSYNKDKWRLKLSFASAGLTVITVMLWITTGNTSSADLGDALFIATLLFALASTLSFVIYLLKNKRPD
ncbi:MAG: hypothetical protein IKL05_01255 [Clostridia bacterium]|nr:hypothetical protein [Clostridia bacterium]